MVKEIKKGGKRANAGRKKLPKPEKKIAFYIYIPEKSIKLLGGKKALRSQLETSVEVKAFKASENINLNERKNKKG